MKLLNKDVLTEYGFKEKEEQVPGSTITMTRNNFEVSLTKDGNCFYTNIGIDYPIKDLAALRKLYKEVKREELKSAS